MPGSCAHVVHGRAESRPWTPPPPRAVPCGSHKEIAPKGMDTRRAVFVALTAVSYVKLAVESPLISARRRADLGRLPAGDRSVATRVM